MQIKLTKRVKCKFGIYRYGDATCIRIFYWSLEFERRRSY